MYQQILLDNLPVFIPKVANASKYQFVSSTYYIRGLFGRGRYSATSFYARLGELEFADKIRHLSMFYTIGGGENDIVFFFDAPGCMDVMKLIVRLNEDCVGGWVPPLPDMEFVHPAAHALLYSLGGFSGGAADCYLYADPNALDLNRKVR